MKAFRLAIVRQKYRPDGGAERFVSRALEALEQQDLDLNVITREWQGDANPNWHIHLCNPLKLGRISRERGFAVAARALWEKERFDLVQSHERIPGCDIYRAGDGVHRRWLLQRARLLPEWRRKWLFSNRYHRYVMCAERAMYAAPELKAVICNAEMIKQEIIADFGVPADKITVIYNAIDNQKFPPADEAQRQRLREQYQIPTGALPDLRRLRFRAQRAGRRHPRRGGDRQPPPGGRQRQGRKTLPGAGTVAGLQRSGSLYGRAEADLAVLSGRGRAAAADAVRSVPECDSGSDVVRSAGYHQHHLRRRRVYHPGQNGFVTDALDVPAITEAIRARARRWDHPWAKRRDCAL